MKEHLKLYLIVRKLVVTDKDLCGKTCVYLAYTGFKTVSCDLFRDSLANRHIPRVKRCKDCLEYFG